MQFKRIISRWSRIVITCMVTLLSISHVHSDTWKDPSTGYTWTYRANGEEAEIFGTWKEGTGYIPAISPFPSGMVTIPDMLAGKPVAIVGTNAFNGCNQISQIVMPIGVKSIGMYAFSRCRGLKSMTIPNTVTNIGFSAFRDCSGMTNMTISVSLSCIPNGAFIDCSKLQSIIIPDGVTQIGDSSFEGCSCLSNVTIGSSVTNIGSRAFKDIFNGAEIVFRGNAPSSTAQYPPLCVAIVQRGSTGWGNVPGTWRGISVVYPTNIIRFDPTGGSCAEGEREVARNQEVGELPIPVKQGYTFEYWDAPSNIANLRLRVLPSTIISKDVTVYAQWVINTHTITFDGNGGTGGKSVIQEFGSELVAPAVTRIGYEFTRWSPEVAPTVPDEDAIYTAQWEPNTYTVALDPNRGSLNGAANSANVVFDSIYGELPTPSIEFGNFAGWTLGGVPVTASTKVSTAANHTLMASWNRWGVKVAPGDTSSGRKLCELYPDDYANLTTVVIEDGITELPDGFFDGCDNVENLTLPDSLETIGYDDLPTKVRGALDYGADGFMVYQGWVLGYCDDLAANLVFPQGTIGIGTRALAEFWDLETVAIPDTVKHIGREAFFECTFLDDVTIPDSVETVGIGAFENCSYMQTLNIGSGVRKLADRAFARCTSLIAVAFADGLECVGACAFSNDWQMLSVSLPHSVTNIGIGAFAQCKRINGVSVPTNVKTMPDMFPAAYANVESVTVAAGETEIMESMFEGCIKLSGFTWTESVTNVGTLAFFGCQSLEAVSIPDSVVQIGVGAFSGCSALHDLTLSRSLTALPDYAFGNCGSLDSFIVPASVVSLGYGFISGSATTAVYYLGNAPQYDSGAYSGVPLSLVTYVVRGTRGWDGTPSSRVLPESWLGHDITYWTPNRFDATFDANGGYFGVSSVTTWSEQQITDMGYVLPNQNPVRPGYAFEGWWTERTAGAQVRYSTQVTATKAHTLYAHWRFLGNLVTTTFNANGGTVVVPGSQDYIAGQTYGEFPVPSRRGYVFLGWWTTANGGEHVTESTKVPSADIELFAHWVPIGYYVKYDANGGTGWMTNSVHVYDRQSALEANRFSKSGHAFSGWARSADGQIEYENCAIVVNLAEVSNEVVTLYAVWSGAGYNVRFDSNGGTGVMENQTIQIGETQNLHTNLFAYSGREFLGWAETSSGAVVYKDGEAVCDLSKVNGDTVHLYAVWRVSNATWRVSFDANGGSVAPGHWNVAKNDSLDALPLPTRPGFTFEGWWTQRIGGSAVVPPIAIVSDMTVYAHWHDNDDQLPPVSDVSGVAAIMGDSADLRLGENIKTVAEYNALVAWADENGIGHRAVRESLHAWTAYRMGAERLFENAPTIEMGDVTVAPIETLSSGGGIGTDRPTGVTVSVTVKDGDDVVQCVAEKVKEMFEATTDLGDWSDTAKLEPAVTVVEGSDSPAGDSRPPMRFTVVPGDGTATRAFLRVRVK